MVDLLGQLNCPKARQKDMTETAAAGGPCTGNWKPASRSQTLWLSWMISIYLKTKITFKLVANVQKGRLGREKKMLSMFSAAIKCQHSSLKPQTE